MAAAAEEDMVPLNTLPVFTVYLQNTGEIIKVLQTPVALEPDEDGGTFWPKNKLADFISTHCILSQHDGSLNFRLDDILLFHFVDEESMNEGLFMQSLTVLDDIEIEPSQPLFHSLSALYFFFKDVNVKKKPLKILNTEDGATAPALPVIDLGGGGGKHTRRHRGGAEPRLRGERPGRFTKRILIHS